jgi:hypothetical protein
MPDGRRKSTPEVEAANWPPRPSGFFSQASG